MSLVRSGPLRRTTPLRRGRRLRPVSPKRERINEARKAAVLSHFGERPRCGACLPLAMVGVYSVTTGCWGWADDAHEVLSRARSGRDENLTDVSGIVPASRRCHTFLTEHDDIAQAAGLALPSGPVRQPLLVVDERTGERRWSA